MMGREKLLTGGRGGPSVFLDWMSYSIVGIELCMAMIGILWAGSTLALQSTTISWMTTGLTLLYSILLIIVSVDVLYGLMTETVAHLWSFMLVKFISGGILVILVALHFLSVFVDVHSEQKVLFLASTKEQVFGLIYGILCILFATVIQIQGSKIEEKKREPKTAYVKYVELPNPAIVACDY